MPKSSQNSLRPQVLHEVGKYVALFTYQRGSPGVIRGGGSGNSGLSHQALSGIDDLLLVAIQALGNLDGVTVLKVAQRQTLSSTSESNTRLKLLSVFSAHGNSFGCIASVAQIVSGGASGLSHGFLHLHQTGNVLLQSLNFGLQIVELFGLLSVESKTFFASAFHDLRHASGFFFFCSTITFELLCNSFHVFALLGLRFLMGFLHFCRSAG